MFITSISATVGVKQVLGVLVLMFEYVGGTKGEQEAVCNALGHRVRRTAAPGSLGSHALKSNTGHQ